MLTLTGITQARRDHSLRDTLRGPAILGLCLAVAAAFLATVWNGPTSSLPSAPADTVASCQVVLPC